MVSPYRSWWYAEGILAYRRKDVPVVSEVVRWWGRNGLDYGSWLGVASQLVAESWGLA